MIYVAKDGSGDYTTIQSALNSISTQEQGLVTIFIKNGVYKEKLYIDRPNITLEGEGREETIVSYSHYAKEQMGDGSKRGTFRTPSVFIDTHDFTARNITFQNSSGPGTAVGQALALYVDGDRIQFENCNILGGQDTLFTAPLPPSPYEKDGFKGMKEFTPRLNGRHYYRKCFIHGDIDFIFGGAAAYFEECKLFSEYTDQEICGYVTAASTPEDQKYGYVFNSCSFESNCPKQTVYLGRPWRNFAKVVIMNSYIGEHICEEGWHDWGKADVHDTVFFAEYENYGPGSGMDKRPKWVKRLGGEEAGQLDKKTVLEGWLNDISFKDFIDANCSKVLL